ncbi:MAG: AI-2E family transporter [Thiohalospira sp.]
MNEDTPSTNPLQGTSPWHWLLGGAALVILLTGLRAVDHLVTPFLLAAFLAIICAPLLAWMKKRGVPGFAAVLLLFLLVGFGFFLLFLALKGAAESLATEAPFYQQRLSELVDGARALLVGWGVPPEMLPEEVPLPEMATVTGLAGEIASGLGQFTASTLLVLLFFMFMLVEEHTIATKLEAAFPGASRERARRFLSSVYGYLVIKTGASFVTGVLVATGLWLIGVDFPLLWGILAGLLNFVPTIGSIIAAIPAVLIALLGLGVVEAVLVAVLFGVVNVAIGSVLEPRLMGRSLGLSPLVVLLSLLAWGWVFGPVGMLLSIPLTMIA